MKSPTHSHAYHVRSLWYKGKQKIINRNDMIPLPKNWSAEAINITVYELLADLKRPVVPSTEIISIRNTKTSWSTIEIK